MVMKQLGITMHENDKMMHIEGYPDAIAIKLIQDPMDRELQPMALHHVDLSFCHEALIRINTLDKSKDQLNIQSLWISSITIFFKCFPSNKARKQLSAQKILKNQIGAVDVFSYFKNLRNKHIIHDENPYSQSFVAVALMKPEAPI
ncbi:MAG: hypothetical protein ABSA09_11055 [Desulfobaccales bacterium]|jgi:hypothetical protein